MTRSRPTRPTYPPFTLSHHIFADVCNYNRWTHEPVFQRELHAQAALGAVLNRRAWWIQWARRPAVRVTWLAEIEAELVRATVTYLVECWASREHYWAAGRTLVCKNPLEHAHEITRIKRDVMYPPDENYPFDAGGRCESESDHERENDGLTHVEADASDGMRKKATNPFLQILWYVKMELVRGRLRAFSEVDWTKDRLDSVFDRIDGVDRDTVLHLVFALIDATRGPETAAAARALVLLYFPDEHRSDVRELLALHLLKIRRFVSKTLQNVECILRIVIDTLALRSDKPLAGADTVNYVPGPVPRTWLSDNAVPRRLKAKLLRDLTGLTGVEDGQTTVRRLVDRAFHCAVVGETIIVDAPIDRGSMVATHLDQTIFAKATGVLEIERNHATCRCKEPATYLRVPSQVDVRHDCSCAVFRSYIRNLDPHDHAPLYKSLASLFVRFVPLFDQVVSTLDDSNYGFEHRTVVEPMLTAVLGDDGDEIRPSSALRRLVPPGLLEAANPRFTLKRSRCQVIIHIEEITLAPSEPRYAGELWQLAGTDAERVLATGVYCAASTNMTAPRLSFRVPVRPPPTKRNENCSVDVGYGLHDHRPLHQELGSVTLREDRCVAYPSIYEHTTSSCELIDTTKLGSCKLVTFLLVDPLHATVASTAHIPPPQDEWLKRAIERAQTRSALPDLVVSHILSFLQLGKTHEQGLEARRRLLEERAEFLSERLADRKYRFY